MLNFTTRAKDLDAAENHERLNMLRGEKVTVAFNLHRHEYSIRYAGKVVAYATNVLLADATFTVNERGRQQVIRTQTKNLHAFTHGTLVGSDAIPGKIVRYNPYEDGFFKTLDGNPVASCGLLYMYLEDGKYRTAAQDVTYIPFRLIGLDDQGEFDLGTYATRSLAAATGERVTDGMQVYGTRMEVSNI